MIIIGEKINSSGKAIRKAIEKYDAETVKDVAIKQCEAGANYIDINASAFVTDEPQRLEWLIKIVQEAVTTPVSIDSQNPKALEAALKVNKNSKPIINSITDENERFEAIISLVTEYNTGIIALCMDDTGMPETVDERVVIADRLINKLTQKGVAFSDIYIDPLVRPIGTGSQNGVIALESIRTLRKEFPNVHMVCGISNISFGIPARKIVNQTFFVAAMNSGLDCAILNPLDNNIMSTLYAADALFGVDEFCMNYLMKFREGLIEA